MNRVCILAWTVLATLMGAWGAEGHRAAGLIAEKHLTEKSRAAMADLLGDRTLATAGTWADEIRSDRSYDWAKPLHYINVPLDADHVDRSRDCPSGECVLGAIQRFSEVLKDPTAPVEKRREALFFLIHFIEDIHQPLHVSYARDRGGNMITVSFMGRPGSNLHRVWDSDLIDQRLKDRRLDDWMAWAIELRDGISPAEVERYHAASTAEAWANESLAITRELYKCLPASGDIDAAYVNRWIPTVEDRIKAAGLHLAMHLNEIFDPPCSTAPAETLAPATSLPASREAPSSTP